MAAITCWSPSEETKVIARPLVPKRPARLHNCLSDHGDEREMIHVPHAVKVAVGVSGAVVVDNDIDTLHIDTTTKYVGGHQNTLLERLERSVARDTEVVPLGIRVKGIFWKRNIPLFLRDAGMNGDAREVTLDKKLVQLDCTRNGLDEDDDLRNGY